MGACPDAGRKAAEFLENETQRYPLNDAPIEESDEDKPGVILDYDKDGNVVGLEILQASKRISNPRSVEYAVVP